MIERAYIHVPFYRGNSAYCPRTINSRSDLSKLPIIRKSDLREHGVQAFLADDFSPENCVVYRTSGTTGEPVSVFHDHFSHNYHTAAGVRRLLATGHYLPTYRALHIRPAKLPKLLVERFGLFRRDIIPAWFSLDEMKARIIQECPQIIIGYPTYLRELIAVLRREEIVRIQSKLKAIFTESELLIDEHRKLIESTFGVPVFDDYSSYESLSITFECSHHRTHIVEDRLILEIVDDSGQPLPDGEEGNVILTPVMARAMPLIRYAIGDRGVRLSEACPCRRRFTTFKLTQGRSDDYIVLQNNVKVFNLTVLQLAAYLDGVNECFVHQEQDGTVNFYYVPKDWSDPASHSLIEAEIRLKMKQLASAEFPFNIIKSKRIPRGPGGKGKIIHSEFRQGRRIRPDSNETSTPPDPTN
jgi:phenylacetate-CoA ligase